MSIRVIHAAPTGGDSTGNTVCGKSIYLNVHTVDPQEFDFRGSRGARPDERRCKSCAKALGGLTKNEARG